jgi:hypothetical protein
MAMLSVLIGVLIICVVGAICFWAIEKFINDSRLANLLKILVVLICVGAILRWELICFSYCVRYRTAVLFG